MYFHFRFHVLLDFDEDKRSCRRKLERHNKRRRRKPDSKGTLDKEIDEPLDMPADVSGSDELREGDTLQFYSNLLRKKVILFSKRRKNTLYVHNELFFTYLVFSVIIINLSSVQPLMVFKVSPRQQGVSHY